jgi:hypothetical protein
MFSLLKLSLFLLQHLLLFLYQHLSHNNLSIIDISSLVTHSLSLNHIHSIFVPHIQSNNLNCNHFHVMFVIKDDAKKITCLRWLFSFSVIISFSQEFLFFFHHSVHALWRYFHSLTYTHTHIHRDSRDYLVKVQKHLQ